MGLVSKNVTVNGHRTSMRLEPVMWDALREAARREGMTVNALVSCETAHGRDPEDSIFINAFPCRSPSEPFADSQPAQARAWCKAHYGI